MIRRTPAVDYAFAVGKIRVLEKRLIKEGVFQEAIEARPEEALRLFVEADLYGEGLLQVRDSQRLEEILKAESARLEKTVSKLILDKALLELLDFNVTFAAVEAIKNYGSRFLSDYLMSWIDMHNIKTFLRLSILKEPEDKLKEKLIDGGFITGKDFIKLYPQDIAVFLRRLEYVKKGNRIMDYAFYLKEGIEKAVKERSFVALEKDIADFLIHTLKPAKYLSFGPEPVIAYYFAKSNEINLIRMIILAKLNNAPSELVKERLNNVYA